MQRFLKPRMYLRVSRERNKHEMQILFEYDFDEGGKCFKLLLFFQKETRSVYFDL